MSAAFRRADPRLFDAIVKQGGEAGSRCIQGPHKRWARAHGISRSRATRHLNGDPNSPFTAFLAQVASAGSPWPLIATAISIAHQVSMRIMSEEQLFDRLKQLDELEHNAECEENRLTVRVSVNPTLEMLEQAARANDVEADICEERSAILKELARRKREA